MKKNYTAKAIAQSPGKHYSNIKNRVAAIEDLLQEQENARLASEIYNDGYNNGWKDAHKGDAFVVIMLPVLGAALGLIIGMIMFKKDGGRSYSGYSR